MSAERAERGILDRRARNIVSNVNKYFENEKTAAVTILNRLKYDQFMFRAEGVVQISPEAFTMIMNYVNKATKLTERVTSATGVNKNTLSRIRRECRDAEANGSKILTPKKRARGKKIVYDNFDLIALHNIVNTLYMARKEVPSLKKIHAAAKKDLDFPGSVSTIRKILMDSLGYKFKKCQQNKLILVQKPNIRAWRARYLRRIRENDALGANKKPVIYLGETWIHADYTVKKCWLQDQTGTKKKDSVGRRWIITHAGGENGFIEGALLLFKSTQVSGDYYHDEMRGSNFAKWIHEKLIPKLPQNAIIVMDNTLHHSIKEAKPPTLGSKKAEMHAWLNENNIPFEKHFSKSELYEIVMKHKPPKNSVIDDIFMSSGFEVLRLPPYNYDLNAIEYIWQLMKCKLADKNFQQIINLNDSLREAFASITKEDWQKEVNRVKMIEKQYWEREMLEDDDNGPFNFEINMGEDESSESSEESDSNSDEDAAMSGNEY